MKFADILILLCVLTLGCASTPPMPAEAQTVEATRWSGSALRLPERSPVVLELNPSRVFSGVRSLKDWFVEEPENWGVDGPRMTRLAELYWGLLSTYAGGDPSIDTTWHGLGIDPMRPLFLGVYPMDADTQTWFDDIENAHTRKEGFGQFAGSPVKPLLGFRLIVPIHHEQTLKNFTHDLATTLGYQIIRWDHLAEDRTVYATDQRDDPWFSWVVSDGELLVDFVYLHQDGSEGGSDMMARAIAQKTGAPDAPRPPGEFDLAIGFHQIGVAKLAKTRGYLRAVSEVQSIKAQARDARFHTLISNTQKSARAWELRADRLPGLTYSLTMGEPAGATLEMAFILDPSVPDLKIPKVERGLGISEHGLGLMVDFFIMNDPAWKSVLSLENTDEALSIIGAGDDDSMLFAFAFPRSLALISGNIVDAGPDGFSNLWAPLIAALPAIRRLELAAPDAMEGQLALHATLKEGPLPDVLQDAARSLVIFLDRLRVHWSRGTSSLNIGGLEPEVLQPIPFGGSEGFGLFSPQNREVFLSTGTKEIVETTRNRIEKGGFTGHDAVYLRLEPASLVTYLLQISPERLPAIQTGRLAQRTGPWIFRMAPDSKNGARMIRWRLEISAPPNLE